MLYLRQSTASQEVLLGPFLDDTDGKTAETALSIANTDIKIWKRGGTSEASKNSGGATHIASGRYYAVLDATDTDTIGELAVNVHVSGALPVRLMCCVLDEAVFDVLFGTTAPSTLTAAAVNAECDTAMSDYGALKPTTAGRTLDVTATGEAGIDWANIGSPTTTVGLSGTTVKTATDVETDTVDIQSRIPTSLVGGRIVADATAISGDSTAADNLEAILDGTGAAMAITAMTITGGIVVTQSTANEPGVSITGNGTGAAMRLFSADGPGLYVQSSNGNGIECSGWTAGVAIVCNDGDAIVTVVDPGRYGLVGNISGTLTTVTNLTNLPAIPASWLTAAGIDSSAVTAIQGGLATASALTTVDTVVDASKVILDKLDTALELDGSVYRYTTNALEQAPSGGGGGTDWTADEKTTIKAILGIPASGTTPDNPTTGILDTIRDLVVVVDGVADSILEDTGTTLPAQIAALNFSTHSAADVWAVATRALTDKAGFSLSGTITTFDGFNTSLNSAHGSGSWATATGFAVAGDAMTLTTGERDSIAVAMLDLTNGVETSVTVRGALRAIASFAAGVLSGAGGTGNATITFKAIGNTGTTRLTMETDADGNRASVTLG